MSSPLAWQGDGPPQPCTASFSPHGAAQFDASQSLASLTFIAAQLSTLLNTITLASPATAPSALNPVPITSATPSLHSPLSTLIPLSNSLTLCHCNLISALTNVLSTSFQLLTLSTPLTPHSSLSLHSTAPQPPSSSSSSASPLPRPSISVPPRFTIRVVSDLEPVTPPASLPNSLSPSRACSPTHFAPSSPTHLPITPTAAVYPNAPTTDQSDTVVKATLHLVSAAAVSTVSSVPPPGDCSRDDNDIDYPSLTLHPTTVTFSTPPTATDPSIRLLRPPTSSTDSAIDLTAADPGPAVSVDKCDVAVMATSTNHSAAATPCHASSAQPVINDDNSSHCTDTTTCRPSTRSASTPIHPFFIDLTNRTGKAAKHFRRLYPATRTICECGLFPIFTDQRHSSAPTCTLPEPLRRLCLACLEELYRNCSELSVEYSCIDVYNGLVAPQFWSDTWYCTLDAHYDKYYTPQQFAAIQETNSGPSTEAEYNRALEWVKSSLRDGVHRSGRKLERIAK